MEKHADVSSPPPTTYVQADAVTFKDLVQKLTGAPCGGSALKLRSKLADTRRSPYKLQDRRKHSVRDLEMIKLSVKPTGNSPGKTRSNTLNSPPVESPTTPLGCDGMVCRRVGTESPLSEEERAIAEKRFYLHASPGKVEPPVLLTLFPLTSPKHEY
ncbi:VQ motif-containing protein 31-like [Sesamum indicum]|uniref:VQ motif-containing protein 31-like n=1 Tax=Sesamum indicum TaxID=4182 RepID=A0A6I9TMI2_SESIN|nr:VQ motif-containing protein 31-like [Sesamum indicum]